MQYGTFDDEAKEYVITDPNTPLPWINYLGCEDFIGLISNHAGGYTFYRDARLRRLTRYRYNNVPTDFGGRYLYLRNNETNQFWSPTWLPTRSNLENYECRMGLGYTKIYSGYQEIAADILYFIPLGENLEIWELSVTNMGIKPIDLSIFSCVEFCLWNAQDDAENFQRNFSTGEVEVEAGVIYHKTEYRERRNHYAYFTCSHDLEGFDTQRKAFLGSYRGWDNPEVVERGISTQSIAHGWSPIGSHHIKVSLAPNENKKVIFLLGYHENPPQRKFNPSNSQNLCKESSKRTITYFLKETNVKDALDSIVNYWNNLLETITVKTPNVHVNRMVNLWNAYQCMITFKLARSASFFESGIGRGIGFRDSNQDLLGIVHMVPEQARQRILDLAATQLQTGGAYHQYQPLTKKGNDLIGSNFNDDPLWLILSVSAYIKETGDISILEELVEYNNEPSSEKPLLDHLMRSIAYTNARLGPHGLPLIGRADWNDCLNLNCFSNEPGQSFQTTTNKEGKIAESVFIAALFTYASRELAEIFEQLNDTKSSSYYFSLGEKMEKTVYNSGWDGNWFLRAYDDRGDKVGSHGCEEGQIFIEPQGFCTLAGIGLENGFARTALNSVKERLATNHGIELVQPAFSRYYLHLGEISSYPPGYKENASVFCHTNPWIMIAEAILGNGDQALDYYLRINPSYREAISDIHSCEPYVYAQMIAGRDAPTTGEAKNSWLTGTAAWNYVAITQWILGIQPTHKGLRIAPNIPKNWQDFNVSRTYRGVKYHIEIERRVEGDSIQIWVDGKKMKDNVIPLSEVSNKDYVTVKVHIK